MKELNKNSRKTAAAKKAAKSTNHTGANNKNPEWMLRLYIAGMSANAFEALQNLEAICEEHLGGRYKIEIVDLLKRPQLASGDQIIAVPTLVRQLPPPVKKIIGDLSNKERVLVGLDVRPVGKK